MNIEQFRQLADLLPEPMVLLGGDDGILGTNRKFLERFGEAMEHLTDAVADDAEHVQAYLRKCRRTRTLIPGSLQILDRSGTPVACRCEGALLRPSHNGDGPLVFLRLLPRPEAIRGFSALNRRIEELGREVKSRIHAENALRDREELLGVTLASIAEGVISTDGEGRVSSINPVAESLTGWSAEEARGEPVERVYRAMHEFTGKELKNPATQVLGTGKALIQYQPALLLRRPSLSPQCPVESSAAPIQDAEGRLVGAVLVFRDVSLRREAEKEILALNERSKFVLDSIGIGRWLNELPLDKLNWDERTLELFFVPAGTPTTIQLFYDRLHPEDRESTRRAVEEALETRSLYTVEHRVIDPESGMVRWLHSTGMPAYTPDGSPLRFDGISYDVTPQKENELELHRIAAELSNANRRKTEFLAMLAHELRNPLAPLRTGLEIIKMAADDAEVREKARSMMERQMEQLVVLIDDLMDISRISRGKLVLKLQHLDLHAVLRSACEETMPAIEAADHTFRQSIPPEPLPLRGDPHRLAQVFSNLLTNAAKYTPRGGRIDLRVHREGGAIVVSVKDSGIGVEPAMQDLIFEMFAQLDRETRSGYAGLGVGLTLVKSLVEMHAGQVTVNSAGAGKGSEFIVRLPGTDPDDDDAVEAPVAAPVSVFVEKRVLVVDDNPEAVESLQLMVSMLGHETKGALDGRQAVDLFTEFSPNVVLMDLGMPNMSGYEAARLMRRQAGERPLLLVAISGWGSESDRRRATEAGFDLHLVKPANPADVEKLLNAGNATQ